MVEQRMTKSEIKMGIKWFLIGAAFAIFVYIMSLYPDLIAMPAPNFNPDPADDVWWIWMMILLMG